MRGSLASLPAPARANGWPVHVQVRDRPVGPRVVVQISPGNAEVAPAERVPEAQPGLPGEVRITRAHVEVERHDPLVIRAECQASFDADDRIPLIYFCPGATSKRRRCDGA